MAMRMGSDETVIDLLLDQHVQIKQLFVDVLNATGDRKQELFYDLVRLLAVHESAEEQVVHPTARHAISDGESVVAARLHEEHQAKHELADLYDLGVDHREFDARLRKLADDVITHATAEEAEEFAELRNRLGREDLVRMGAAVRAAEAAAPTRPHPAAGESVTANMLAAPPVALFDRVRDAVRDWSRG
jgi:hemerythrin superfamily protein